MSRTQASLFQRGKQSEVIPTKQTILEPTRKPHVLSRVTNIISHAAETGAKRIRGSKSGPASTSGVGFAESLRTRSLNVDQVRKPRCDASPREAENHGRPGLMARQRGEIHRFGVGTCTMEGRNENILVQLFQAFCISTG